jgi:mannose-6-phosphate isomerase
MAAVSRLFQLSGTCNNYSWGRKGHDSLAARLCEQTPGTGFAINDDQYYSEMWFGDYPDFPARVLQTGQPLAELLKSYKEELLGAHTIKKFGDHLPFLPKVCWTRAPVRTLVPTQRSQILSISKALPLQIHPNKSVASTARSWQPANGFKRWLKQTSREEASTPIQACGTHS